MFARIDHELKEREALESARQEMLRKKQTLIAENQKRKDDLASLDKDLETFIDVCTTPYASLGQRSNANCSQAAKPIQKIFEKQY